MIIKIMTVLGLMLNRPMKPKSLTRIRRLTAITTMATVALLSGCAAVLEHDARACHKAAMTVKSMTECSAKHPQHLGTVTDTIAQSLGKLESIIQHRNHDHE